MNELAMKASIRARQCWSLQEMFVVVMGTGISNQPVLYRETQSAMDWAKLNTEFGPVGNLCSFSGLKRGLWSAFAMGVTEVARQACSERLDSTSFRLNIKT
jgi:hypothetical protein